MAKSPGRAPIKAGNEPVLADAPPPAKAARAAGKALRDKTPRARHGDVGKPGKGRDPVAIILASDADRLENLIPVRHTRMLESPFAFYRGTAAVQAYDLARGPSSGIVIQCCGDAHLMNFGGFATPERRFIFDVNDFDETFPAPFEWDVKRLAASFVLAARWRGFAEAQALDMAVNAVAGYRRKITATAAEATLDAWYASVTWQGILDEVSDDATSTRRVRSDIQTASKQTNEHIFHKLATMKDGRLRLLDQPPLLYHPRELDLEAITRPFLREYGATLRPDYRTLLGRLRFVDAALKVVGVGSVGTRCYVALMLGEQNEPVFLQVKEARASVLAGAAGVSRWANDGERVVAGQHLMQAASDIFLGWARGPEGRAFYVRQLRDMKSSVVLEQMDPRALFGYARLCGETLARAHGKAGDAAMIAGYLGKSDVFDEALGKYAVGYADQAEKDYQAFKRAAARGRVRTESQAGKLQTALS